MRHMLILFAFLSAFIFPAAWSEAQAQLNNRPFSFNTPSGGVGMSLGGKQVILNREVFGQTPDNLVRGADGSLLSVTKEDGGSAIVRYEGGSFIPSFRGSSFRGNHDSWSVGVFNTFFEPRDDNSSLSSYARMQTGAIISTWTGRVTSDQPVSYMPANPVDVWTGMVAQAVYY